MARAAAMAIKRYSFHFVNTAVYGADYQITQAVQKYDPETTISTKAANAVEFVKDYFMLGEYGENFKTFYYTAYDPNTTVGKYAYQNGGVLSHRETESLGKSGYSWQGILEYYYVKKSGTTYFPYAKESSGVIFTTAHNHDWSNASYCPYCGAEVYFK